MADLATALSSRSNSGDNLRALCPRYPVSTINPPIPRVLANALEAGSREDEKRDGRGKIASGGSKHGGDGGAEVRGGFQGMKNVEPAFPWVSHNILTALEHVRIREEIYRCLKRFVRKGHV